jgi:hypothetical protein
MAVSGMASAAISAADAMRVWRFMDVSGVLAGGRGCMSRGSRRPDMHWSETRGCSVQHRRAKLRIYFAKRPFMIARGEKRAAQIDLTLIQN